MEISHSAEHFKAEQLVKIEAFGPYLSFMTETRRNSPIVVRYSLFDPLCWMLDTREHRESSIENLVSSIEQRVTL